MKLIDKKVMLRYIHIDYILLIKKKQEEIYIENLILFHVKHNINNKNMCL